ncbi:uncharacterized protein [Aegilops tauschii subsp. strangulata]|uniref:uncharacterized protein n=1 Tax=Aegilops tauschii subsp. strangulata TaxID=200361 RepID=UPI003CC8C61D
MSVEQRELAPLKLRSHRLDDACCRPSGGIGGCMLALSIWSWERLPVGRPKTVKCEDWDDKDDPLRLPTWAYKWDVLNETTDDPSVMKLYRSELDTITAEQVEWEPYGRGDSFGNPREFRLNPMLDRRRQRKVKDWAKHHRNTRVEVWKPAYAEEILEDPTVFDELTQHQYNKLVREGTPVPSAPMMNFVRAQIKKAADETETTLETTPVGKSDGEGAL